MLFMRYPKNQQESARGGAADLAGLWRGERESLITLFSWTVFGAVGCYLVRQWSAQGWSEVSPWAIVLAIPYVPFVLFLTTGLVVHELGHAVAAWICGMRVFEVSLGSHGDDVWRTRALGVNWVLKPYPLDGFVHMGHRSLRGLRMRELISTLGGPAANAAVCLLLLLAYHAAGMTWRSFEGAVVLFIGVTNGLRCLLNLYPRQMPMGFGTIPSDGLGLLQTLRLTAEECAAYHADYFLREAVASFEQGDVTGALSWIEKGRRQYPDSVVLGIWSAAYLLESHQYGRARLSLVELLRRSDLEDADKLQACVYLTWVDLASEDSRLIAEADEASQVAIRIDPDDFSARCARGCVLVALGALEQGIAVLQAAMKEDAPAAHKALVTAYLAIGAIKAGDLSAARQHLAMGQEFDWNCVFLQTAERLLIQAQGRREDPSATTYGMATVRELAMSGNPSIV